MNRNRLVRWGGLIAVCFLFTSTAAPAASKDNVFEYLISVGQVQFKKSIFLLSGNPSQANVQVAIASLTAADNRLFLASQLLSSHLSNAPFKQEVVRKVKPIRYGARELLTAYAMVEFARIDAINAVTDLRKHLLPGGKSDLTFAGAIGAEIPAANSLEAGKARIARSLSLLAQIYADAPDVPLLTEKEDLRFLKNLERAVTCTEVLPGAGAGLGTHDYRVVAD